MAATCQERGITHVKDIFTSKNTSSESGNQNDDSMAGNFFFGFDTGTSPAKSESQDRGGGYKSNTNSRPGGFMMRSGQNKGVDIMELPVPPPRRKSSESSSNRDERNSTDKRNSKNNTPVKSSPAKDTYLTPRTVQRLSQESTTMNGIDSGKKGPAPPPPPQSPVSSPPPPPPQSPVSAPPPPPPVSSSSFILKKRGPAPSPPISPQSPSMPPPPPPLSPQKSQPPALPPTPPPPSPPLPPSPLHKQHLAENNKPANGIVTTAMFHRSDENHTYHIDSTSPLMHNHRNRSGSGDYTTGSLFNGDDDRDIIKSTQDDSDVFNDTGMFSMDNKPPSPSTGLTLVESKPNVIPTSPGLFKKKDQHYNSHNRLNNKDRSSKHNAVNDNESSLLSNSEHGAASSGYFSSTDSDRLPSPPPAFKSELPQNGSSSSFEEDECTLDFGDDGFVENKHTKVYQEYQGEDFGKYMQEDDITPSTTTLTRRVQRHKQQHPRNRTMSPQNREHPPPPPGYKKPGIKEKITQAFTLTRSDRKYQGGGISQPPKTRIQQFSFMNSKMGMYASEEELHEYMSREIETRSDIGGVKKVAPEVPSWHKDTLSVSTLRRAKTELDKRHMFSTSVPNLTEAEHYKVRGSSVSSVQDTSSPRYGESYSDFGADIKKKKKVNRFKFWKAFGKKKDKKSSQIIGNQPECVDVRL